MIRTFKEIFAGTFTSLMVCKWKLLDCLLLPVIALSILDTVVIYYMGEFQAALILILRLVIYTLIAVTTHRIILLGPNSSSRWKVFMWTKREFSFALSVVLLLFILAPLGVLSFILELTSSAGTVVISILMFIVIGRFALVFPGIAIDKDTTFDMSWKWTRGYTILMFVVVGIGPYLLFFPSAYLASNLPHSFYFFNLFISISLVIEIALISNAYKTISEKANDR